MRPAKARLQVVWSPNPTLPADTHYELGVLTKAPAPDGVGWTELEMEGYERAPVTMGGHRAADPSMMNTATVCLGPSAGAWDARWTGLFGLDGELAAYGTIEGAVEKKGPVVFEPGALRVER